MGIEFCYYITHKPFFLGALRSVCSTLHRLKEGCIFCQTGLWWRSSGKLSVLCGKETRPPSVQIPCFTPFGKSCQVSGMRAPFPLQLPTNAPGDTFPRLMSLHKCNSKLPCLTEAINNRMPTNSCATCWTISTGSFSTAATGRLTQSLLRTESDSRLLRENAAREPV